MYGVVYGLCALTAGLCGWLLLKAYHVRRRALLFWSAVFFGIQTVNNVLLVIDKLVFPSTDMTIWRYTIALLAIMLLLYGLVTRIEVD